MTTANLITIGGSPDFVMHCGKMRFSHTATFEMSEGEYLFKERISRFCFHELMQELQQKMSGQGWTGRESVEWSRHVAPVGEFICGKRLLKIQYHLHLELTPQQVLFLSDRFRKMFP